MFSWRGRAGHRSRGSAAIEMAILMPVFVGLFTAAVVIGRTSNVISAVEAAAYDAARTASLARDATTAEEAARDTVQRRLADRGVECVGVPEVEITREGFSAPLGTPSSVTATVSCQVSYLDVDLVGVPADRIVTASFVSPIDQYRTRQ